MHDGDLQVSAETAHDEFHDELRRFKRNLDIAKKEHERNMAKVDLLHDEVKKVASQTHRCLNQINLTISFANSLEEALAKTENFINQWRGQLEKIQNQLDEVVNSFKNPGWIEWFFSLFEFSAAQKASQGAVDRLEVLLKTDAHDPYKAYTNLQQTIENSLSENTISYRLKWRLEKLQVEMKNHSLPALTTDNRFSDITKALIKSKTQDVRKDYQTVFHPVTVPAVIQRSASLPSQGQVLHEGSPCKQGDPSPASQAQDDSILQYEDKRDSLCTPTIPQ